MEQYDLVVKDNALIEASYRLSLAEQRLILMAIVQARHDNLNIDHNDYLEIHISELIERFELKSKSAYTDAKEASKSLFDRKFAYNGEGGFRYQCRWVDKVGYEDESGVIKLRFTQDVIPLITELENRFTSYSIEDVRELSSTYSIRLFELLLQWEKVGHIEFTIERLRECLGLGVDQYPRMSNFKARVLDVAVNELNEKTDLTVTYEQTKNKRTITGFRFKVKKTKKAPKIEPEKSTRDKDTLDMFEPFTMTDKQRSYFAGLLSESPNGSPVNKRAKSGETYDQFARRIEAELLLDEHKEFYLPFLLELGFKPA